MEVRGFHHTSSVSARIEENARFYTEVLGLRFVYRSINQDDVSMYHLAYGDAEAKSGAVVTFFDIPMAAPNRPGRNEVAEISLRVPDGEALGWWAGRFDRLGVERGEVERRYDGRERLPFRDGEEHRMSLVADGGEGMEPGEPWTESGVPEEHAVRGIESATLVVGSVAPTQVALVDVLGFRRAGEYATEDGRVVVFESGDGGPGTEVHVVERPGLERARPGAGSVHHIAFRVRDEAEIRRWAERVGRVGLPNSGVVDRDFFKSVYFREPNGVLFEIATDEPGWAKDGVDTLGERLVLPHFLEDRREEIERNLKPISV
ncbi:Glyoxalase/Bleomycin resistance protein/Dioxygenase superfamily [Rubrobacter radiotolerans]|uniref:Glyoxalase/Bleomycin resistance protein/Dioxygenase superfamily n=1 Tax=Rubrobacter radiotolerans TaxID=42256 RepID=A0A023X5L0_RUBRA|nr:ring-cleaving dioxygenase [Rubrobacter radiotolerans]AHY47295.1 Glyoxalase/Bleomycin resistance protein/Dioxygenase superfamily [Rubrobacter radiotolerans]MDX5894700.1 ring-cleaving dioxygenase [Rubrobacter radiotolerans]SMC06571.1 glyoxalase family protein [Rubrobacter radiotolerans DSM 5868]